MFLLHNTDSKKSDQTAYDFSFTSLANGQNLELKAYQGQVILIVNTASRCGFTKQYEGLENLYQRYKNQGLVVIGVPSNDFGGQEPGTEQEIQSFCTLNYGVSFPMTQKEKVKGPTAHPFYQWAKKTLGFGTAPKWNFHKYLINREGQLIDYFNSLTAPESNRVIEAIVSSL